MFDHHLYAVGNALVDSEYEVSDAQLQNMGVDRRHMTLIDQDRRAELLNHVPDLTPRKTGGGSAGNTVVALSQLGGRAFYSCRVSDDELGHFYADDLRRNGVATNVSNTKDQKGQTGSCLVFVTPDAERSMCTFLGVSAQLDDASLQSKEITRSAIYYMEGYLAASPTGLMAAVKGKNVARGAGVDLALTLSDVSMIRFCRSGLDAMLAGGLDYVFCNEEEAKTWCGSDDWSNVESSISVLAKTVCVTRGARGCLILAKDFRVEVPTPVVEAVDTNGAGDMFAGAFLYAVTQGYRHEQAALLGNRCAAEVVRQHGNRLTRAKMHSLLEEFTREIQKTA